MSILQEAHHPAAGWTVARLFHSIAASYRKQQRLRELEALAPGELSAIATDLGVTASELKTLASHDGGPPASLKKMLQALNIPDSEVEAQPLLARDMHTTCSICMNKRRCDRELRDGRASATYGSFCPNAYNFDWLRKRG